MDDFIQFQKSLNAFRKEADKSLRRIFSGKIKGNFLTEMKYKVLNLLGKDVYKYYDFSITNEKMVSTGLEMLEFDICRHIVGLHRSNLIFNIEEERLEKEKSSEYKCLLANEVLTNIKLRHYGSVFFRKQAIIKGDEFIFFHTPYNLFVLCMRMNTLLRESKQRNALFSIICPIVNKGLAALTLLEDNFLDNAYPICRGITELYLKLLTLLNCPSAVDTYLKFAEYDLRKSCCEQKYSQEFENKYRNRSNVGCKNKIDYLHYGWLDKVNDYHLNGLRPYSISGIISYLKTKCDEGQATALENIEVLYKMCHGYTHGNVISSKYPLLHYFEISLMLYYTISHTYSILCESLNVSDQINEIHIITKIEKDILQLQEQYSRRSTENFELYYQ